MDGPELPAASDDWTADEAKAKQLLEQRLRQRPGDRPTMIALASLLASKFEVGEARGLLEKAQVGILSEPDAGALLRKLSMAKVALWRSMGLTGDGFVDCSEDRREVMLEACDLFEDALAYPENGDDPGCQIEGANAKLAAGDLGAALQAFSEVVAGSPDYPGIAAAIFRAATLLAHLEANKQQAGQYLAYLVEANAVANGGLKSLGYGDFELRALLFICLERAPGATKESRDRLWLALSDALHRTPMLPEWLPVKPPDGILFKNWALPWVFLVDKALKKCDYVLALEFLQVLMLKKEGKTADNMAKFGQAKYLLGDYEKAEEMCAGAIDLDAGHAAARGCLLTWDFDKWGPRLDKAAAAAQKARLAAEARAVREARAERLGRKLADHRRDLQRANVLDVWWQVWSRHYAATEIARCAKGAAARRQSARLLAEAKDLRLRTKAVVWAINSHLMRDVIQGWHVEWVRAAQERKVMSAHFKRKLELQVLRAFVREWAKRARMQVFGRTAAKRAMRGFRKLAMHSAQIAPADVDGDEDEEVGDSAAGKDAQQEGGGGVGGQACLRYTAAWPSLFVGARGTRSETHVDSFGSNFWMALVHGTKYWKLWRREDAGLLYPVCGEGRRDPVFSADPLNPCPVKHPAALLAARAGWEHVLEAGDLLFVPADCPHFVANLDDTVAISANYVDETNGARALAALELEALIDPAAHATRNALETALCRAGKEEVGEVVPGSCSQSHRPIDRPIGSQKERAHTPYPAMARRLAN